MTNEEIAKLYTDGLSIQKVSELSGISNTQIRRILKNLNVESRSIRTNENIEHQVFERYSNGENSELIAKTIGINPSTVCRIIKRLGGNIRSPKENKRKYNIIHEYFEHIDSEHKAYFLGFLMADGSVHCKYNSTKLSVHEKDIDILEKLRFDLFPNEKPKICSDRNIYKILNITSSKIKEDLIKYGCVPNKTFKLSTLPKIDHMNHFMRGFYDGDGCIYISKENRVVIILTGYTVFLENIQKYLSSKDINTNISLVKPNVSELRTSKLSDSKKLLEYLYDNCTIYLNRKYEKYKTAIQILDEKLKPSFNYGSLNIISYNGIKLTENNILQMSIDEKEKAAIFVFNHLRQNGFPYPRYSNLDMLNDFDKLKKSKCLCKDFEITNISDAGLKVFKHFSPHYFEMSNTGMISMVDAFEDDEALMSVIKNRMGITYKETFNITGNMIRQGFRNSRQSFAGSIFKPALAKFIYDEYTPENGTVLDISVGFGQRLLGAMASSKVQKYVGLDPWKKQIDSAKNISEFFGFNNNEFHCIGSEKFNSGDQIFDICFSSPPFFNKEIYCNEDSQAYYNRDMESFIYNWWIPTADMVHKSLVNNGLFILNMNETMGNQMLSAYHKFKVINKLYISFIRSHLAQDSKDIYFVMEKI